MNQWRCVSAMKIPSFPELPPESAQPIEALPGNLPPLRPPAPLRSQVSAAPILSTHPNAALTPASNPGTQTGPQLPFSPPAFFVRPDAQLTKSPIKSSLGRLALQLQPQLRATIQSNRVADKWENSLRLLFNSLAGKFDNLLFFKPAIFWGSYRMMRSAGA